MLGDSTMLTTLLCTCSSCIVIALTFRRRRGRCVRASRVACAYALNASGKAACERSSTASNSKLGVPLHACLAGTPSSTQHEPQATVQHLSGHRRQGGRAPTPRCHQTPDGPARRGVPVPRTETVKRVRVPITPIVSPRMLVTDPSQASRTQYPLQECDERTAVQQRHTHVDTQ